MQDSHKKQISPERGPSRWTVLSTGDNGTELVSLLIPVEGFEEGSALAGRIAHLIASSSDNKAKYHQITLRAWQVQVIMAAPVGRWESDAQRDLATDISALLESS